VIDIGDVVRDWKCERKPDELRFELWNRSDDGCWRDRARHLERGDDAFAIARGERALRDGTFRHRAAVLLRAAPRKLSRLPERRNTARANCQNNRKDDRSTHKKRRAFYL